MESVHVLHTETIEQLQKLIRTNLDSANGFRKASSQFDDLRITELFLEIADERAAFARELQSYVKFSGSEPINAGSAAAKTHRLWMEIRNRLAHDDPYPTLAEAERGEDVIRDAYQRVLLATPGTAVNDVLLRQYERIQAARGLVREMRQSCSPTS
jgi:uncharacterized protein (TIGR02284 family)